MSELRANTISDAAGTGPVTLTGQSAAKAWCHIDVSAGVPSLADSYNVSGITDLSVGRVQVSFTSSMSGSSYATPASTDTFINGSYDFASASVNLFNNNAAGTPSDPVTYVATVSGDLA